MRYFDSGNKVRQDPCAIETRERENQSYIDYNTYNFYASGTCGETYARVQQLADENPNMRFRVGYGVASDCTIDQDNKLRYGFNMTHGPERQTLNARNFVACPDFSRGQCSAELESALINSVDTKDARDCQKLAEMQLGVFQPLSPCIESHVKGAFNVIDDDIRIGKPSKDIFMAHRRKCEQK